MDKFINDIYDIYDLINNNNESKSFINIKTISKQYLAYYIYRIITKYMEVIEMALPNDDINNFMKLLRIPKSHNKMLNYPLAGKFTNDDTVLNMIILSGIDILNKINAYIKSLPKSGSYEDLYLFLKEKDLQVIIQDLIDLQKLIPGLSVSAIRPNYIDDNKLY